MLALAAANGTPLYISRLPLPPLVLNSETLQAILQTIVWEQNMEYIAGYYTQPLSKTGRRKVKVVLKNRSRGQVRGGEKEF
ncbi:MAG: hypothetical protein EHM61_02845 [Acidobacteria bacterium]|nr:MAG: hypothetical protein EHM61_02845 [Acidobacteriota bacterium]